MAAKAKKTTPADKRKEREEAEKAELAAAGGKRSRLMARRLAVGQSALQTQRQLEDVAEFFTYHAPTDAQVASLQVVRDAARNLAEVIVVHAPRCSDQSAAIRLLRECVMTANAAIVLEGKVSS